MSTSDVITAIHDPAFYNRVGFIALKVAQQVAAEDPATANHVNRVNYSNRIFTGSESDVLLAEHVVASNPTIAAALESGGPDAVPDGDIEFALATIWDARANAFSTGVQYGVTV